MQEQASDDLKTRVLEKTGWDPAYMSKFLGAVQECEATVRAWLAPADDFSDAAGSARTRGRDGEEDAEEEKKAKKKAVQRGEKDEVEEEEEETKVGAEEPVQRGIDKEEGVQEDSDEEDDESTLLNEVEAFVEVFGHLPMTLAQQEERKLKLLALHFVIDREVTRMREESECGSTLKTIQKVAVFKLEHEGRLPTNSAKSDETQRALARDFGRVRQQCKQDSAPGIVADAVRRLESPKDSSNIFEEVMEFQRKSNGKLPRERSSDHKEAILAQRYRKRSKAMDLSSEEKRAFEQVKESAKRQKRN
jgi:hypothetical protein